MDDSVSQSLAGRMISIAPLEHWAGRQQMDALISALRGVMAGREISDAQLTVLSQCIVNVLRGQGGSNFALAAEIRQELTTLGIGDQRSDLIVRRFVALGETVRGPDDMPVMKEINLTRPYSGK